MIQPFFLVVFAILSYLAVLYESKAALAACLVLIFWLLGGIFQLYDGFRKCRIELPFSAHAGEKEDQVVFTFTVSNASLLPLSGLQLHFLLLDQSGGRWEEKKLLLSLPPKSHETYSLVFSSPYCGRFRICLTKIRLQSFFSLVWFSRKDSSMGEAVFFPKPLPVPVKISERTRYFSPEGEEDLEDPFHSASAAGSFQEDLRSYQPGDPVRLVHWKLSARTDTLLVRTLSGQKGFSVLLFLELARPGQGDSLRQLSSFFQWAASLSFRMLEMKCSHMMVWFDVKEQCLRRLPVGSEEELDFALYCLLHGDFYSEPKDLYALYSEEHPTDTWACRLLLDTSLTLWQEDRKLLSSRPETLEEDLARTELLL